MRPRKVEDILATLKLRIQSNVYRSGMRLPAERDLAAELGIARSTLRRALHGLEAEGYVSRKRGVHGGWFVTDLARPIAEWHEAMRARLREVRDVIDFRIAVEGRAAELAALRRSPEQLEEMRAILQETAAVAPSSDSATISRETVASLRALDSDFHSAILEASASRRLAEAVRAARAELFALETRVTYEHIASGLPRDHRRILMAIERQDPEEARAAMVEHIQHGAEVWLAEGLSGNSS